MQVAIAGATGFVGTRLVERLQAQGMGSLRVLTRNPERARVIFPAQHYPQLETVAYTPQRSGAWQQALDGCDAAINLAGEPLADKRWTPARKREIRDSRAIGTRRIVEAIAQAQRPPQVLINASAVGYYGTSETATFDESSPPGSDFLAQVCQDWEAEAQAVERVGTRLAILRFGIVMGPGGALGKMLPPFRSFLGGPLGSGRQWVSWIARDDLADALCYALNAPEMQGTFNATAPNPVRMRELADTLGRVLNRPSWLPVPGAALELLLGEGARVVLEGQRVLPNRLQAAGFPFQYPTLEPALAHIVAR